MRPLTTSLLFVLGLTAAAAGQPPQPVTPPKTAEKKAPPPAPKADPTDAVIAAALANDADVKVAKAKIQLAEAELAKARQAVTLKVLSLKAKVDQHRAELRTAEERYGAASDRVRAGVAPQAELHDARDKVDAARAALALAEAELKLLTGGGAAAADSAAIDRLIAAKWFEAAAASDAERRARLLEAHAALAALNQQAAMKGPIPDRVRAALDKPVKLGAKGEKVALDKALEAFKKEAGLDVPVRGTLPAVPAPDPKNPNEFKNQPIEIAPDGEELPVGAWLQLFEDSAVLTNGTNVTRYRFYVRDYGLLISATDTAPPDAPTLTEFWKQKAK